MTDRLVEVVEDQNDRVEVWINSKSETYFLVHGNSSIDLNPMTLGEAKHEALSLLNRRYLVEN